MLQFLIIILTNRSLLSCFCKNIIVHSNTTRRSMSVCIAGWNMISLWNYYTFPVVTWYSNKHLFLYLMSCCGSPIIKFHESILTFTPTSKNKTYQGSHKSCQVCLIFNRVSVTCFDYKVFILNDLHNMQLPEIIYLYFVEQTLQTWTITWQDKYI